MTRRSIVISLGVLVVVVLAYFSMYNRLVALDLAASTAWAQVENQLQRRNDLIPNLVSAVKGYVKHEREVLDNLAKARAAYSGAASLTDKVKAANDMQSALARLLVIVENYPNLKANETFNRLMDELAGTENRITVERMRYNQQVQAWNTTLRKIPYTWIASRFGFSPKDFFQVPPEAKAVPKVSFE